MLLRRKGREPSSYTCREKSRTSAIDRNSKQVTNKGGIIFITVLAIYYRKASSQSQLSYEIQPTSVHLQLAAHIAVAYLVLDMLNCLMVCGFRSTDAIQLDTIEATYTTRA